MVAALLIGAAVSALASQADGGGALLSQIIYLVALALFAADYFLRVRKSEQDNGRYAMQLGAGVVVAAILFAPDFGQVVSRKVQGVDVSKLTSMAHSDNPDLQMLALELCLRRRLFKDCRKAFELAAKSQDPVIKSLGKTGLKGRSGVRRK